MFARFLLFATCLLGLTVATAFAAGTEPEAPLQRSPQPPAWTKPRTSCVADLADTNHPSGLVGYVGYNVPLLLIVDRRAGRDRSEHKNRPGRVRNSMSVCRAWRQSAMVGDLAYRRTFKVLAYGSTCGLPRHRIGGESIAVLARHERPAGPPYAK